MQFKMLEPVRIKSWAVLVCKADNDLGGNQMGSLTHFINAIVTGFTNMGMQMPQVPTVVKADDMGRYPDPGRFNQAVTHLLNKCKPDVVFVIIPRKGALQLPTLGMHRAEQHSAVSACKMYITFACQRMVGLAAPQRFEK
jgi:hypothetical protein